MSTITDRSARKSCITTLSSLIEFYRNSVTLQFTTHCIACPLPKSNPSPIVAFRIYVLAYYIKQDPTYANTNVLGHEEVMLRSDAAAAAVAFSFAVRNARIPSDLKCASLPMGVYVSSTSFLFISFVVRRFAYIRLPQVRMSDRSIFLFSVFFLAFVLFLLLCRRCVVSATNQHR